MKILFIGESWLGSSARGLREALVRQPGVLVDDVSEDAWFTKPRSLRLRALNRFTRRAYRREFNREVLLKINTLKPDYAIAYKGFCVEPDLIRAIRATVKLVNVYPDYSPHAYGDAHRRAMGMYDLVISTKPYHPAVWHSMYGYDNPCVFVRRGYNAALHSRDAPSAHPSFDVVMVATWREEYGRLMRDFVQHLDDTSISVAIGGNGWAHERANLPSHWQYLGPTQGHSYVGAVRSGRVCIAPLNRKVCIDGKTQPGDVDTARTYELAAAYCFFIHQRTDFLKTLYDEESEVPMFDDAQELAQRVRDYLGRPNECKAMAHAAHARAVPAYSFDTCAREVIDQLKAMT